MKGKFSVCVLLFSIMTSPSWGAVSLEDILNDYQPSRHSMANLSSSENQAIFSKYCVGDSESPDIPTPNYSNQKVAAAALRLSRTKDLSDRLLEDIASKNLSESIDAYIVEFDLRQGSVGPSTQAALQSLISELGKTTWSTGFSDELKSALYESEKTVTQEVLPLLADLLTKLKSSGGAFDSAKFFDLTKRLEDAVKAALRPIDYAVILRNLDLLSKALTKESESKDDKAILDFLTRLQVEVTKYEEDLYIQSELTSMRRVIAALSSEIQDEDEFSGDVIAVNDLLSWIFYSQQGGKDELNPFLKDLEVIRPSLVGLEATSILKQIEAYRQLVEQDQKNGTNYAAANTWNLYSSLADLMGGPGSDYEKAKKLVQSDFTRFESSAVLSSVQYLRKQAEHGNPSSLKYILTDIQSKFDVHADMHVESVMDVWKALLLEFSKSQSAELIESSEKGRAQMEALAGPATAQFYQAISELDAVLSLSLTGFEEPIQKLIIASAKTLETFRDLQPVSDLIRNTKIERLQSQHFYFYGGVTRIYGLSKAQVPQEAPSGTRPVAHIYLAQLCGEYRDRATMIESKLNWIENLIILGDVTPKSLQTFSIDVNRNVWSQIPADAYERYLYLSEEVWSAKDGSQNQRQAIGRHNSIDTTVEGFTICETKYMFSEYVGKDKQFDDWDSYKQGYEAYASKCSQHDLDHYYDFRGDSNFKHYSPESNGMIWYATSIAKACQSPTKAKSNQSVFTDQDCSNYFTRPFESRYNAARAGLMAWLFRSEDHAEVFRSQGSMVAIYPHTEGARAPFSFGFDHEDPSGELFDFMPEWLNLANLWNQSDMGFNTLFSLNGSASSEEGKEKAFELIRDAVDRHTDWYSSGYNDKNGTAKNQAYSPFVASSYEMSESDNFTSCGITVQCPDDGLKRWMFIFKVHKDNWYTPERLARGEPIDFNRMWFDETAFGDSNLANTEKAWDRLGSPMEPELDSILYLIHVNRNGSEFEE